jgi:restriction system protein
MAVWLVRAGRHGEYEQKFLQENRIYVTWDRLNVDLGKLGDRKALSDVLTKYYPDEKKMAVANWVGQIWPFGHLMQKGDFVLMPLKAQPAIAVGEITGDYHYEPKAPVPYFHWRPVKWIEESVPRINFGEDLLFSMNGNRSIYRVQRNDAESRVIAMNASGWKPETSGTVLGKAIDQALDASDEEAEDTDLEVTALDQIARKIESSFARHDFTRLIEAILLAQGYTTYRSPEGPDGGVDILAGTGSLGFGSPRLCVEVKSGTSPIDRPTVDKLLGAVTKFKAHEGLFVSWSGYTGNVRRELSSSFFNVRLWDRNDVLKQLFANYDQLDEEIKAELPLKRIWTLAKKDEEV